MKSNLYSKAMLALLSIAAIGCSHDNQIQENADTANSVILVDDVAGASNQTTAIISDDGTFVFKNNSRNANSNQTDEELIRGTRITIPLFDTDPIDIRVGRWGTVAFSLQGVFDSDSCGEPLTDDQIDQILESAEATIDALEVAGTFDGEPLELMPNFRTQGITNFDDGEGNCLFNLPWRFYINPQSPGAYTLTFSFTGGDFERSVNWVRP
jgi:hypothetical protein